MMTDTWIFSHLLAVVNNTAKNIGLQIALWDCFQLFWVSVLFSIAAAPTYIPINAQGSNFSISLPTVAVFVCVCFRCEVVSHCGLAVSYDYFVCLLLATSFYYIFVHMYYK